MSEYLQDDLQFERLAEESEAPRDDLHFTPSRLKSKIYSALVRRQQESGPLKSLAESAAAGSKLCVFEELVRITPLGEKAKSLNYCRVCHARVFGEKLESAPIYWQNCPYVGFQRR